MFEQVCSIIMLSILPLIVCVLIYETIGLYHNLLATHLGKLVYTLSIDDTIGRHICFYIIHVFGCVIILISSSIYVF